MIPCHRHGTDPCSCGARAILVRHMEAITHALAGGVLSTEQQAIVHHCFVLLLAYMDELPWEVSQAIMEDAFGPKGGAS